MLKCLNRNTLKYQTLKNMSGVSEFVLESTINYYLDKYDRYPELDEIPGVNSKNYLKEQLDLIDKEDNKYKTKTENILNFTGTLTIQEALPIINNKFKDLEVDLTLIDDITLVDIKERPAKEKVTTKENIEVDTKFDKMKSASVLKESLKKFKELYGINIIPINLDVLNTSEWKTHPEVKTAKAFVLNGNIYVNTDIASIDSPIHELLHIFLGAMRFTDAKTYYELINLVAKIPNLRTDSLMYFNRTQSDILEELFVLEFAKFLTGEQSFINSLPDKIISTIFYNINRNLDTMLMGKYSIKGLDPKKIIKSSIVTLANSVESSILNPKYIDVLDAASLHRKLANTKENLLKKGQLTEICN